MPAEFKNEVFKIQQALSVESIRIEKNFIVVKIIEMMKENPEITIPMIAETLHKTTRAIEKSIAKLQSNGFVKRVGLDKGGHWEIM